jgi:heparosan-N-sulfate-glucuronate 5-epimerase
MRSIREIRSLATDFWRYITGHDYFRQPQPLGSYFSDARCYYNDVRGKAAWTGPYRNGVPVFPEPDGRLRVSPCMVMLYGLGSVDRFLLEGDPQRLHGIRAVARWLQGNVSADGFWPDYIKEKVRHEFYSANSAMNQGLALSFLVRVIRYVDGAGLPIAELTELVRAVAANMLKPAAEGGTTSRRGSHILFLEYCRRDEAVVFNGWVYAVFGLMDYVQFQVDEVARAALEQTLNTMRIRVCDYQLPDGWSRYDDHGRISSPFYHRLHISLLDALSRLTAESVYVDCLRRAKAADTLVNRIRYTVRKIGDKLTD